jgi:hypothetical protein
VTDIQFADPTFAPSTFDAEVLDNNGAPKTVLDAGTDFIIRTRMDLSDDARLVLGGKFQVAAYVESIGPGPEQQVGPTVTHVNNGTTPVVLDILVGGGTLPNNPPPGQSGAYKVVTLLTHLDNAGNVDDVAAVAEGPVVRIG